MIETFRYIMGKNDISTFYGIYFLLWLFSILYLSHHRNKMGQAFYAFAMPAIVGILVIFNPLCAVVIDKCLQGSFWRVYWAFNIVIIIACVGTIIVFDIFMKDKRLVAIIVLFISIIVAGKDVYSTSPFERAENMYKVPNSVIEVCDLLSTSGIDDKVAVDKDLAVWIRQYDATITTLYGREFSGDVGWGVFINDIDLIIQGLEKEDCEYFVVAKSRNWSEIMVHEGYKKYAETDDYDIWKVR